MQLHRRTPRGVHSGCMKNLTFIMECIHSVKLHVYVYHLQSVVCSLKVFLLSLKMCHQSLNDPNSHTRKESRFVKTRMQSPLKLPLPHLSYINPLSSHPFTKTQSHE